MAVESESQDIGQGNPVLANGAAARFFEHIQRSGALLPRVSPQDAASAVLCTISQRISGGEAQELVGSFSPLLRVLLQPCVIHRGERGQKFGREEYLSLVGHHLHCSPEEAERISRAVFAALRAHMPTKEIDDVESQLPGDLKPMWRLR